MSQSPQNITVLGSTGSIGVSTLDVLARHPDKYRAYALTANTSVDLIIPQIQRHSPRFAVMRDERSAQQLEDQLFALGHKETAVLSGEKGLLRVASDEAVSAVMAAIVGAAGLSPTMAAVTAGKKVLPAPDKANHKTNPIASKNWIAPIVLKPNLPMLIILGSFVKIDK